MNDIFRSTFPFIHRYCLTDEIFTTCKSLNLGMTFTNDIKNRLLSVRILHNSLIHGWSTIDNASQIINCLIDYDDTTEHMDEVLELIVCAAHSLFWRGAFGTSIPLNMLINNPVHYPGPISQQHELQAVRRPLMTCRSLELPTRRPFRRAEAPGWWR